ncbi:3,4-dihydroxy-2-butanone-4-phosphate synthase [Oceanibacterium hippocampi]|uniref:3,4-dihydroxy-2-butanone 4-phosphate synthase n=1 Tax=Oceanibacterium hippocampi TaxID=745714 RepID=A0A1Y5TA73_9PROT|nr:3,4-dihydroxy-2-butanone-4-phosphate synthase [Oceanibacterium hippocampi]SLN59161.1 3,4-dihydroxy-2-butanone 4-phosphate synthase [Oceanibacterium hippocampi]
MNQINTKPVQFADPLGAPLASFGDSETRVRRAVEQFRAGGGVLVVDDEDRENEGDLIFPADSISVEQMAMLIRDCSGIVCLAMTAERLAALELPQMVADNSSRMGTAFTVSIEAKEGVTTGVSAADRVTTVRTAANPATRPGDLARPGHIFPLRASAGGVLTRPGHTEASVDLALMAGREPAAVLCELTNPDGTMARLPQVVEFALLHNIPVMTIADLIAERRRRPASAA